MKKYFSYFILLILPFTIFAQAGVEKKMLFENKVEMYIPSDLKRLDMGALDQGKKIIYISADKTAKLTIELSSEEATDNDIPDFMDKAISAVKGYPEGASMLDDGVSLNDGKNIGYVKYETDGRRDKGFNYLFYGSLNQKLISFYFNCPKEQKEIWEKKIDAVVASLRIRDIKIE